MFKITISTCIDIKRYMEIKSDEGFLKCLNKL